MSDLKTPTSQPLSPRFLNTASLLQKLSIKSRTTLLRLRRQDPTFPLPRLRGEQLAWYEHEVVAWMQSLPVAENRRSEHG